jgi:hypothetical protein
MSTSFSSVAPSNTDERILQPFPILVSRMTAFGPITFLSPISVFPYKYVFGMMIVSLPILTSASMYAEAGSIIVTPFSMCASLIRLRMAASTSDR